MAHEPSPQPSGDRVGQVRDGASQIAAAVKPKLRGWLHAGMSPIALAAGIVLVALSPTTTAKWTTTVFAASSVLLFTTSAVYHRGTWTPKVTGVLRRLDHSNIFAIIAGTYTPLTVLLLPRSTSTVLLWVIWSGALLGLLGRVFWLDAPRWLYTPIYVALGSAAMGYLGTFAKAPNGPAIVWLVAGGGVAYILGAVVYATKWPNPSPRWFGFHEVFHSLTVIGFSCHYIAVSLAAYSSV
ncbi:hemolysin-III related [mine drainage metagenome]|uniref:Hemolysin-III related n=1 Tax=mine drainage metagenome TaxID=410659 RepID=A0A1J5RF51_9ZZZZ